MSHAFLVLCALSITTKVWATTDAIPTDIPLATRNELGGLSLGAVILGEPDKVRSAFCPPDIRPESQIWLWNRTRDALAVAAMRRMPRVSENRNKLLQICANERFPHVRACMQRPANYADTSETMSERTANSPDHAKLPDFLKNPELQKKLLWLKDIESARQMLKKLAPNCITYQFSGSINSGTFPDSRGRLMIQCSEGESTKYMTVSYYTNPETEALNQPKDPLGNISVVEESTLDGKRVAWYADYKRVTSNGRVEYQRNMGKQNCATCHPSGAIGVLRAQIEPTHLADWRKSKTKERSFVYTPDTEGKMIQFENLGPAIGRNMSTDETARERNSGILEKYFGETHWGRNFMKTATPGARQGMENRIRSIMSCERCHEGASGMYGFAPVLRGPFVYSPAFVGAIGHNLMPLDDQKLSNLEQWFLILCLQTEHMGDADPDKINTSSKGQLYRWLRGVDCKTGQETADGQPQRDATQDRR